MSKLQLAVECMFYARYYSQKNLRGTLIYKWGDNLATVS